MDAAAEAIIRSYDQFDEDKRLDDAYGTLQRRHTQEILLRFLPVPGVDILDVGGATGAYSFWLADQGHRVHLVDLTPRHIERARQRNARARPLRSCVVADARELPFADASADAEILHGPLYQLVARADRDRCWAEARRVLRPGGVVFGFGITRHAGLHYGLSTGQIFDDVYYRVIEHEVKTGERDNDPPKFPSLRRAYFHLPAELEDELRTNGFSRLDLLGVVGPAWNARQVDESVHDSRKFERLMAIARLTEHEPLLSQGMVAIGRKPQ